MIEKSRYSFKPEAVTVSVLPDGCADIWLRKNIEEITEVSEHDGKSVETPAWTADEAYMRLNTAVGYDDVSTNFDAWWSRAEGWRSVPVGELKSRAELVAQSKVALAEYLETHPLLWRDGKCYSVTAEKQSLLTGQLALYSSAVTAGIPYSLKWNAKGEPCCEWSYEDLFSLAYSIGAYVQPLVSQQQEYEVCVLVAQTDEEANRVVLTYG